MTELHEKYAPILRFTKGEHFFPTRVDDVLPYSSLYLKDQAKPLIARGQLTPDLVAQHGRSPQVFLRSVVKGSLSGADVVAGWGQGAVEMVYRWAGGASASWTEELARQAYHWLSPKTKTATQLFWWNNLLADALKDTVQTLPANELPRLTLPAEIQTEAAEQYQAALKKSPGYTYYYYQVKDGPYLCLQYWFFYSFNDWGRSFAGLNDHEGDWESILLFFRLDGQGRPQEPPAYITFANHESRQTKPWQHPDVTRIGNHPVGYAGAGSHATYPEPTTYTLIKRYDLVDYASGDGVTIEPDQWVHRLNLDEVRWLRDYQGSWGTRYWLSTAQAKTLLQLALAATPLKGLAGLKTPSEIELPGVSAPRGPVGSQRPQTTQPVAWAEVPAG